MKLLFFLFFFIPLIEIYFLIKVGSVVGALMTIALVVFTAMLGAVLVRAQGFSTFARVQAQLAKGNVPAVEVMEGLMLFVAGALLLTPGFFTDAIGFVLLTPPLRRGIIFWGKDRGIFRGAARMHTGGPFSEDTNHQASTRDRGEPGRIIDAEFKDID